MEFMYSEWLTPVDFMNFHRVALEIKKQQDDELENAKKEQYLK